MSASEYVRRNKKLKLRLCCAVHFGKQELREGRREPGRALRMNMPNTGLQNTGSYFFFCLFILICFLNRWLHLQREQAFACESQGRMTAIQRTSCSSHRSCRCPFQSTEVCSAEFFILGLELPLYQGCMLICRPQKQLKILLMFCAAGLFKNANTSL